MSSFWLADSDARVLGPVGLDVVRDLALRGKLNDVRAVSKDGKTFVPVREVPEIQQALAVTPKNADELAYAQADATKQIREWLTSIKGRSSEEVFRVPQNGSREAWRAAFFSLVGVAVLAVNSLNHLAPLVFLGGAHYLSAFETNQLQALALMSLKMHARGYAISGVFFGIYMLLLGYLIFRSNFLPRILGVLMAIGGLSNLTDSFAIFLVPALAA